MERRHVHSWTPSHPGVVNLQPGFYPVRTSPFLYMNPSLGSLMDSTGLSNAIHTIVVEFVRPNPIPFIPSPDCAGYDDAGEVPRG